MIHVLYYSLFLDNGGVERMFYEWIRNFDRENFKVDILTEKVLSKDIKTTLENLGCKIFVIPYSKYPSKRKRLIIEKLLRENNYDIVHAHIMVAFHCDVLRAARKVGIQVRIAHSHNVLTNKAKLFTRITHRIYRPVLLHNATDYFACGSSAGISLFGPKQKFTVINNGIDLGKFTFNEVYRKQIRDTLNAADDDILVGSVGRLDIQKNYSFLLQVFQKIVKENPRYRLLLVGDGTEADRLKAQSDKLAISDKVIFYGISDDVPAMMSAMDIFVLPSLFEGLGLVLVEAQAIGLPCVASDRIPEEVNITDTVKFLPLDDPIDVWCKEIMKNGSKKCRYNNHNKLADNGYDIKRSAAFLEQWYKKRCRL